MFGCGSPALPDGFRTTWLRLRVTLEGLRRTRATIDADFHCRMADERDDSDGYYCKQEFHLALLPGLWFVAPSFGVLKSRDTAVIRNRR